MARLNFSVQWNQWRRDFNADSMYARQRNSITAEKMIFSVFDLLDVKFLLYFFASHTHTKKRETHLSLYIFQLNVIIWLLLQTEIPSTGNHFSERVSYKRVAPKIARFDTPSKSTWGVGGMWIHSENVLTIFDFIFFKFSILAIEIKLIPLKNSTFVHHHRHSNGLQNERVLNTSWTRRERERKKRQQPVNSKRTNILANARKSPKMKKMF